MYGAEVMLLNLVEEQIQQGLQPVIASIGERLIKEKPIETEAEKRGLPLKIFRMRPGLNVLGAKQVLNYCCDEKFDIFHSHGYKCNILLGPLPGFIRKKPMLSTLHGYTSTTGLTKMRVYEWLDVLSLRFVDGVVLVNKGMLQNPKIARLNKKKLFVVDNGIPAVSSPANHPKSLDPDIVEFCKNGFVIGSIGRYSVEKGFDLLLKAFCLVLNQIPDAKLLLLGEGGQRKQYEKIIQENNMADKVMLTGYRSDAWQYLDLMDVYVISSLTEGLPITLLEAMRNKTPVIATRVGGIPDVLKDGLGGVLIEPGNAEKIYNAVISQYFEPGIVKKNIEYSYERFLQKYSSKTMSKNYHQIYHHILNQFAAK